jgi:hypothetical protein
METLRSLWLHDGSREHRLARWLVTDNGDGTFTLPESLARERGLI